MIHPTAIIDPTAELADDVSVGPYAVIGPQVKIGSGTWVGPHAVVNGPSDIGKNNKIFQFASVGEGPQDKKYAGEETRLVMGDNNVVRECVTIHRGTIQDTGITTIGSGNLFMAYSHIAHDCVIGNDNVFVNSSTLAGHVTVGDHVIISAFCAVHQFCFVGDLSFLSHACLVSKDVLPFTMITGGSNATVCGLNVEGLKRAGLASEEIDCLRIAYRAVYRESLRAVEALEKLRELSVDSTHIKTMADALEHSTRGILR